MIKAKKRFGQNFLHDENIKNQIIESIPNDECRIVEIGPGLGDLTRKLLVLKRRIDCFEIDNELCEILKNKFKSDIGDALHVSNCDVLKVWNELSRSEYFLVANLPYYIATNIILKAIDDISCKGFVVTIQREVARKFSAKCTQKEFCALSVLASLKGEAILLFDVPSSSFTPAPKVISSVIRLVKDKDLSLDLDYEGFKVFLRAAFASPRKTLLKNLLQFFAKEWLENFLTKEKLSLSIRPHELSVALYLKLFKKAGYERRKQQHTKTQ